MRLPLPIAIILIVLGSFLLAAPLALPLWEPWVRPLVYDAGGSLRAEGLTRSLGLFLYRFLYDHLQTWPLGVLLVLLGLSRCTRGFIPWSENRLTRYAQMAGAVATGATVLVTLPLFLMRQGTDVQPIGWVMLVAPPVVIGAVAAILTGLPALLRESPRFPAAVGLALCLAPLPAGLALLGVVLRLKGVEMAQ